MKKFLIIAAHSRLAQAFHSLYQSSIAIPKTECDITNKQSLEETFKKYPCDYVLNCAALTDIEYCEKNPTNCLDVNTIGVSHLNDLCQKFNKKLIHISSDYAVHPINIYGYSKYLSEQIISSEMLIIRTNFYDKQTYVVKKLLSNEKVSVYTNQQCNPISLNRLVEEIEKNKDKTGLLNIFTDKKISWQQFAQTFCSVFEKDSSLLVPTTFTNTAKHAPRPLSSFIKPDITITIAEDLKTFKQSLL